jgi:cytoskeleton protein RodZ
MFYTRPGENASDASAFPAVDPADGVPRQIGEWLRHARTHRGEDLDDVGEELRIKPAYLDALERGDLSVMPGRTYALGFLRAYALYLGYDGDDLVRRVKAATRGAGVRRPELSVPTPVVESRVPRAQLLVLSLVLAAVVYGGWHFVNRDDRASLETIAEVPEELRDGPIGGGVPHGPPAGGSDPVRAYASESSPALPQPREVAGATAADPAGRADAGREAAAPPVPGPAVAAGHAESSSPRTAAEAAEPPAGLTLDALSGPDADAPLSAEAESAVAAALMDDVLAPAEEVAAGAEEEEVAQGAEEDASAAGAGEDAAADVGPAAPAGSAGQSAQELLAALDAGTLDRERERRVYGRANRDARIVVEALETAWVQVRSTDSSYTYTRTLQPGDVYLVPNRRDLALWTGNAGGIRVAVDGRTLPPLGRPREVKRDISLDPEALLSRASGR